ncbi:MAG: inositol monophosphatase [Acetobacteraceae bacterium]
MTETDAALDARERVLLSAIRAAGRQARAFFERRFELKIEMKGAQDYLTEADKAVERVLAERFADRFPRDGFLGEEGVERSGEGTWVVDPIDGTANFVRGIPHFCVSIGFVLDGTTRLGAILQPTSGELHFARLGRGATLNGRAIRAAETHRVADATVEIGWSTRVGDAAYLGIVGATLGAGANVRRAGSGALGLAYVADGRSDAYAELHMNSWDALAGLLIVAEAGGRTNDFLANDGLRRGNPVFAAAPGVAVELSRCVGISLPRPGAP